MAVSIDKIINSLSSIIYKSISIINNYKTKCSNPGIKSLLISIEDQDKDIQDMITDFQGEKLQQFSLLEIDDETISQLDTNSAPDEAENDKYFLLLFSQYKEKIALVCQKIVDQCTEEEPCYLFTQIKEIQERQFTLLKDRYDLEVL
jgi:hypothetical protein